MIILYLGPYRPQIAGVLALDGSAIRHTEIRLTANSPELVGVDWIVSYGYKHIIKDDVLRRMPGRVVNLHISYLPFNRGADPNLWSFLEDTPKGVTIHQIDPGIDTGDIIAQQRVEMADDDTLTSSYERLSEAIETLFARIWPELIAGQVQPSRQPEGGTFHRSRDKQSFEALLTQGWETPVREFIGRALVTEEGS
jgi:methionyl-tRNA formyltransferase